MAERGGAGHDFRRQRHVQDGQAACERRTCLGGLRYLHKRSVQTQGARRSFKERRAAAVKERGAFCCERLVCLDGDFSADAPSVSATINTKRRLPWLKLR